MSEQLHRIYGKARLNDRQINELIGLAHGLTADGKIDETDARCLQRWLSAHREISDNPVAANLSSRIHAMLCDGELDNEESKQLFETLYNLSGGNFELDTLLKSSGLPLDEPPPEIVFLNRGFCFTGTFAYGTRKECERAIETRGGICCPVTYETNYLVVGIYATGSWKHSSFGAKIEKAMRMKARGADIAIIGELHWCNAMDRNQVVRP